jgi:dTDP-4-amino-4,6-dideoxygalactose transaminase
MRAIKIKPFNKPIYVTQPLLPRLEDVYRKIRTIWRSKQLTNIGVQHKELEKKLRRFLRVKNLSLFCNGTMALDLACRVLNLSGEIITTPFTFPATLHVLYWNRIKPIFCDIKEDTFTIDPDKIEKLITPKTTAIMPVHIFGNPCDVWRIQKIADGYKLKIIYDAAHAFGIEINGIPIGNFGDISMFSFHATKVFNTIEGGCLTFKDKSLKEKLELLKNFGIKKNGRVILPGVNAKLNEIQAAIGILNLKKVKKEIKRRKILFNLYKNELKDVSGIVLPKDLPGVKHNYSYFPILIKKERFGLLRDDVYKILKKFNIFTKKYFYPLCSHFPWYKSLPTASPKNLPKAEMVAKEILCLPLYGKLKKEEVKKICYILKNIKKL